MNIEEITKKRIKEAQTISITGIVLENKWKDIITIIPCFCVQDTPDNPCPCTDMSKIFISKDNLVGDVVSLYKKSIDGEQLSSVLVERDANILVEQTISVKAENAVKVASAPILPRPTFPFPPTTGPTFPYPDPNDPEIMFIIGPIIKGLVKKYGPAVAAGVVGAIGGWLGSDDKECTKVTTTSTTTNPDGSITRSTHIEETCK